MPSRVCTKLGFKASFKRAVIAPSAFKSPAFTGLLSYVYPTINFESLFFKSWMDVARQKTAITSEATVISNPSLRGIPFFPPPRPS